MLYGPCCYAMEVSASVILFRANKCQLAILFTAGLIQRRKRNMQTDFIQLTKSPISTAIYSATNIIRNSEWGFANIRKRR